MKDQNAKLLSACAAIEFGPIRLSSEAEAFRDEWNEEIIALCQSLPDSTRTDAILFFMQHSGISFDQKLNFFKTYYTPTWSIIYWLLQTSTDRKRLGPDDSRNAKKAHSMAMFLHALDDHLKDGQLPVTHLALLLRSQSWSIMNDAFNQLGETLSDGKQIVQRFINDYYSSIRSSKEVVSLDAYCERFRKQMATGMIAPVLLLKKINEDEQFAEAIESAYGSFGIAWRLLDDIKDIGDDMRKGIHSSIYICLPEDIKEWWDRGTEEKEQHSQEWIGTVSHYILEKGIIERIKKRICMHLESAAEMADKLGLKGWADEYRCLLKPLQYSHE